MGVEYHRRPVGFIKGFAVPVSTATLADAHTTLANYGVNAVVYGTSGVSNDMVLPAPSHVGQVVSVVVDNQTTSLEANINTDSTGNLFWGSTNNTITIAADKAVTDVPFLEFTAISTSQWAVTALSSTGHWAFSLSTGSTGQS